MPTTTPLPDAALAYARAGWRVFPVRARGKRPLTPHGHHDATTDAGAIRDWWTRWPRANVGLPVPAGIVVLDLDSAEALQRLKARDLDLPSTVRATTGRGVHLWYRTGKAAVRNRVGLFDGVDVRAAGGYVVVPPSVHPSGSVYRWDVALDGAAISECPGWLLARVTQKASPAGRSAEEWHRKLSEPVEQGRRNQVLAQVAGFLFRRLPAACAAEMAACWAEVKLRPPLPEREVRRTIESIAGRELRRRGGAA
ncbi:MAG: DNA primase [Gemmatimonadetes bacterium]|nr:MAG: DNA primase [Gemmatimonadota bacterium]